MTHKPYWTVPLLALGALYACSSSSNDTSKELPVGGFSGGAGGTDSGAGGAGAFVAGGAGGSSGAAGSAGSAGSAAMPPDFTTCGGSSYEAEDLPIDMFIMLDHSTSMTEMLPNGKTRWANVTEAINAYLTNGAPQTLRVGLQYFALGGLTGCQTTADGMQPDWSQCSACGIEQYDTAAVPIDALAVSGPAIAASIAGDGPSSASPFTPTAAAVQGGLKFATAWAAAHPERSTMFVLVTDGYPTQCDPQDTGGIANFAATAAAATPVVRTVVVGVGMALSNLNTIAVKGGSHAAILVPDTGDATQQIVDGLSKISHTPLSCTYSVPQSDDGGKVDPAKVNVRFTPDGQPAQVLYALDGSYQCTANGGGWYYADTSAKDKIVICPTTCQNFVAGVVDILVGCTAYVPPLH
jgi:hypothetical protein